MPVLLEAVRLPVVGDLPLLSQELWGIDIMRMAVLDGSVFLYLKAGQQSCDSTMTLNKELQRAIQV